MWGFTLLCLCRDEWHIFLYWAAKKEHAEVVSWGSGHELKKKKKFESLHQPITGGASVGAKNALTVFLGAQNNHVRETCERFEIGVRFSAYNCKWAPLAGFAKRWNRGALSWWWCVMWMRVFWEQNQEGIIIKTYLPMHGSWLCWKTSMLWAERVSIVRRLFFFRVKWFSILTRHCWGGLSVTGQTLHRAQWWEQRADKLEP